MEREFDPAKEYLKTQHLEAEYECRTAHKAIKRGGQVTTNMSRDTRRKKSNDTIRD